MQEKHAALSAQMDGIRRSKPFFKIRLLLRRSDPALKEYQALSAQREQLSCEAATLQEAVRSARRHVESLQKDLREKKVAQQEGQRRRAQLSGALEDSDRKPACHCVWTRILTTAAPESAANPPLGDIVGSMNS